MHEANRRVGILRGDTDDFPEKLVRKHLQKKNVHIYLFLRGHGT
jgi:hypothetical protein